MGTVRQNLQELLHQRSWTSLELSQELRIEEREVFGHLAHVKKSLPREKLVIDPYLCLDCGYAFKNRVRLDRPGRCPKCRDSHIRLATFTLTGRGGR